MGVVGAGGVRGEVRGSIKAGMADATECLVKIGFRLAAAHGYHRHWYLCERLFVDILQGGLLSPARIPVQRSEHFHRSTDAVMGREWERLRLRRLQHGDRLVSGLV